MGPDDDDSNINGGNRYYQTDVDDDRPTERASDRTVSVFSRRWHRSEKVPTVCVFACEFHGTPPGRREDVDDKRAVDTIFSQVSCHRRH